MELEIYNTKGEKGTKKVKLNKEIFNIEPNDHAIYLDVKHYRAAQRQGTHKAKERAEVKGSTKKIKKQKGTGTARAGDIKNPLFRGGGRAFGPAPRDYSFKLNKKVKKVARKSALSYKVKNKQITVIEDFTLKAAKTKSYSEILSNLKLNDKKVLLVLSEANKNIYLSSRNLPKTKVLMASELNTYELMHAQNLLLVESSVKKIENLLS